MNKLGVSMPFPPARAKVRVAILTLALSTTLGLAACGTSQESTSGSTGGTDPGASTTASASHTTASQSPSQSPSQDTSTETTPPDSSQTSEPPATTTNSDGETLGENYEAAESLAQASGIPLDSEEVKTTEELYGQVQSILATIQPVTDTSTESHDSDEEISGNSENVEADQPAKTYLPPETIEKLGEATTGSALDQYVATATEYALSGWRTEGTPTVVGEPRLAESEYDGKKAKVLEVCLDSSQVKVVDENGNAVGSSPFTRSLNIFTLVEDQGKWKIASHDFPNNADC